MRKEILDIQTKLSLTKNHLSAIYHTEFIEIVSSKNSTSRIGGSTTGESTIEVIQSSSHNISSVGGRSPISNRKESIGYRKSSCMLTKYAPALEKLRKKKYEETLKKEKTKC